MDMLDWRAPEEFETITSANKPFSLRVPALVVSCGKSGQINIMLAMWFTPVGFDPSSFLVAIDRNTKTSEFIDETGQFVVAAPEEKLFEIILYASTVSGHQENKWEASGLTALKPSHVEVPLVAEALANVELKLARIIPYDDEFSLYVGEVLACHVRKDAFKGGIYRPGSKPLLWLGKESGLPRGKKDVSRHAAGLGRIWQADESSPLLKRRGKL